MRINVPKKIKEDLELIESVCVEMDDTTQPGTDTLKVHINKLHFEKMEFVNIFDHQWQNCSFARYRLKYLDGSEEVLGFEDKEDLVYDKNKIYGYNLHTVYPIDSDIRSYLTTDELLDIPCYIINLSSEINRYDVVATCLKEMKFTHINRWIATDNNDGNVLELLARYTNASLIGFNNLEEVSCTCSHLALLENFLKSNDKYRIIFEDNIVIASEFLQQLEKTVIPSMDAVDILYLGGTMHEYVSQKASSIFSLRKAKAEYVNSNVLYSVRNLDTHAYVINRKFAYNALKKYRSWQGNLSRHNDYYAYGLPDVTKALLTHDPFVNSNIDELKIKNENTCGLFFQKSTLFPRLRRTIREVKLQKSGGVWLRANPKEAYDYNHFRFSEKPNFALSLDIPETGILMLDHGVVSRAGETFKSDMCGHVTELSYLSLPSERTEFYSNVRHGQNLCLPKEEPVQYSGSCLNLGSLFSAINIAHFLLDSCGKLSILHDLGVSLDFFDWIIIPDNRSSVAQQIITKLPVIKDKLIFLNPAIDTARQFELLYSPSINGKLEYYRKGGFNAIRSYFNTTSRIKGYNIYISRENAGRDVENMEELSQLLAEFNFEIIEVSKEEDVLAKVACADIILAPHGAGLANCVFAAQGASLIELIPEYYQFAYYMSMAYAINAKYYGIICKDSGEIRSTSRKKVNLNHKSFNVDIQQLRRTIFEAYEYS